MSVGIISHEDCLLHDMGEAHPESPLRIQVIEEEIAKSGLDKIFKKYVAPEVTREQLLRVHDSKYIDFIFKSVPKSGIVPLDPDTWMNPYTVRSAVRAAGSVVSAVDLVLSQQEDSMFCNIRPPGHHAERNKAMGFCFFNNVAVGVAHALEHHKLKRVAIVDFDVHHGNGTEDIFINDDRVLLCSSFQHPFYPMKGAATESPHIINIPLPEGTTGKTFRKRTEELWFDRLEEFQPEMIFFSAGFDGHKEDLMSGLLLEEGDYAWLTRRIKAIAEKTAKGKMVSALEGGYALNVLGKCVVAHTQAMLE